jgi:HAMP domain-containing protein
MLRSIRWRLIASYAILTLFAVALVGVLALSLMREHLDRQEREYLTANGAAIARQVLPSMQSGFFDPSLHELLRTASFLGDVRVRLLDASMRVLADSGSPNGSTEFFLIAPQVIWGNSPHDVRGFKNAWIAFALERAAAGDAPYRLRERFPLFDALPADTRFTIVQRSDDVWGARLSFGIDVGLNDAPIPEQTADDAAGPRSDTVALVSVGDERDPLGFVELSAAPNFGDATLNTAAQAFLLAGFGAVSIAVLVGLWVGRGLTRPLLDLSAAAARMSGGDLSVRAAARGRDEIGQLGGQFNRMAERLEASFAVLGAERDALRRFIADASHELRTPITALKTFADVLQGVAADDPVARAEFLAESQTQINRLEPAQPFAAGGRIAGARYRRT